MENPMGPNRSTRELLEIAKARMMKTYEPMPVVMDRGEGAVLYDKDNRAYIDFIAGVAVASLGYGDKEVIEAINGQAAKLVHSSNLVYNEPQLLLAENLAQSSFAERVFFCNSGAEAAETLIKLARKA